jgi:hypothetical protein
VTTCDALDGERNILIHRCNDVADILLHGVRAKARQCDCLLRVVQLAVNSQLLVVPRQGRHGPLQLRHGIPNEIAPLEQRKTSEGHASNNCV